MSVDPITLSLMAASFGAQQLAQSDVAGRQKRLLNAMTQYRTQRAANAQQEVEKFLDQQTPEARAAQNTSVQNELQTGLQDSVGAVQKFQQPTFTAGKLSSDYTNRVASNQATTADRIKAAISQLAGIGAPSEVGQVNARRYGQAATEVDAQQRAGVNVGARYQDAIANQRPDPFLSFASQLLQGASMASAGGAFRAAPTPSAYTLSGSAGGTGIRGLRLP
jgi:hypothetical protein